MNKQKSFFSTMVLVGVMITFLGSTLVSVSAKPVKPGPNYVWVPAHTTKAGDAIPGHWRLKSKKGFSWVKGHYRDEVWVPRHWKPTRSAPRGKLWVPGHVGPDGKWVKGYYRRTAKKGFTWVPGHYRKNGTWIKGHWKRIR